MNKMMLKKQYMMYAPKKKGRLPSGFQEVEYIEGNGNQWIDTNYIPSVDDVIETDIEITTLVSHKSWWTVVFGSYPTKSLWIYKSSNENDSYFTTYSGGSEQNKIMKVQTNVPYNIIFSKATIIVNGTSYSIKNGTSTSQDTLSLFRVNPYTQSQYQVFIGKIKEFKITNNNTTKLDLVPCYRKSDNEIGMYDIVNNQFYTNQGSGTFQYGREIIRDSISGFKQLDYIETSGTQYINTNHIFTSDNQKLETKVKFITTGGRWAGVFKFNVGNAVSIAPYNNKLWFGRNGDYYTTTTYNDGDLLNIKAIAKNKNLTGYVNEQEVLNISYSNTYTPPYNYYLFAQNYGDNNNSPWGMGKSIMYYFRLYENDVIIRNYIPMERTSDGELGMYDLVENKFYTNQGSGTFIKGGYVE